MWLERMPQPVYTTDERRQLKEFQASSDIAVNDYRATARLRSARVLSGTELTDARVKADAFEASRHLWKLNVEGWDKGLSQREVEQAIRAKSEDPFKPYNFLRPTKKEEFGGQTSICARPKETYKGNSRQKRLF
jgi:hypothetical protein